MNAHRFPTCMCVSVCLFTQQTFTSAGSHVCSCKAVDFSKTHKCVMQMRYATVVVSSDCRSEGFPERDIWFLGKLDQGCARCPELLGRRRRRRHLILRGRAVAPPDPPLSRPAGLQDPLTGLIEWLPGWLSSLMVWLNGSQDACPVQWFDWMTARMAVQFTVLIEWQPGWLVLAMGCFLYFQKMKI